MNNTTTSSDLALLMEAIRDGKAVSTDASAGMRRILTDVPIYLITGETPEDPVAHKTGSITGHYHDAGIVYPHDPDAGNHRRTGGNRAGTGDLGGCV